MKKKFIYRLLIGMVSSITICVLLLFTGISDLGIGMAGMLIYFAITTFPPNMLTSEPTEHRLKRMDENLLINSDLIKRIAKEVKKPTPKFNVGDEIYYRHSYVSANKTESFEVWTSKVLERLYKKDKFTWVYVCIDEYQFITVENEDWYLDQGFTKDAPEK